MDSFEIDLPVRKWWMISGPNLTPEEAALHFVDKVETLKSRFERRFKKTLYHRFVVSSLRRDGAEAVLVSVDLNGEGDRIRMMQPTHLGDNVISYDVLSAFGWIANE